MSCRRTFWECITVMVLQQRQSHTASTVLPNRRQAYWPHLTVPEPQSWDDGVGTLPEGNGMWSPCIVGLALDQVIPGLSIPIQSPSSVPFKLDEVTSYEPDCRLVLISYRHWHVQPVRHVSAPLVAWSVTSDTAADESLLTIILPLRSILTSFKSVVFIGLWIWYVPPSRMIWLFSLHSRNAWMITGASSPPLLSGTTLHSFRSVSGIGRWSLAYPFQPVTGSLAWLETSNSPSNTRTRYILLTGSRLLGSWPLLEPTGRDWPSLYNYELTGKNSSARMFGSGITGTTL